MILIDNLLANPREYRDKALSLDFTSVDLGQSIFHGIAPGFSEAPSLIAERFHGLTPTLTFFRKSPEGQIEPNFVHTDEEMGDWTGIFYLNENPPEGDGTNFWRHRETGRTWNSPNWTGPEEWKRDVWDLDWHIPAVFNRLLLFDARLFHSRAIYQNYGADDDARLIQVVFGTGQLPEEVA